MARGVSDPACEKCGAEVFRLAAALGKGLCYDCDQKDRVAQQINAQFYYRQKSLFEFYKVRKRLQERYKKRV